MTIVFIIVGAIILIIGLIMSLNKIDTIVFNSICGVLLAIITLFALFGKALQDKKSGTKTDNIKINTETTITKVDSLSLKNDSLKIQLESQQKTIDDLRKENTTLASKYLEATNTVYKQVTGGNSYPVFHYDQRFVLEYLGDKKEKEYLMVTFYVKGDYGIYDAEFEHKDLTLQENQNETLNSEKLVYRDAMEDLEGSKNLSEKNNYRTIFGKQGFKRFRLTNLPLPRLETPTPKTPSPDMHKKHKYRMTTTARNGVFIQETELIKQDNGIWRMDDVKITLKFNGENEKVVDADGKPYKNKAN